MSRVYFIKGGDAIKIGFSADIDGRVRQLNVGAPVELTLIGSVEASVAFERALHHELKPHRVKGEWFADVPAVRSVINSVLQYGVSAIGYVEPVAPVAELASWQPRDTNVRGNSAKEWRRLFDRYEYVIVRAPTATAVAMIDALHAALDDLETLIEAASPCCALGNRIQRLATELSRIASNGNGGAANSTVD